MLASGEADSILANAVYHQFDSVPDGSAINGNMAPKSERPASRASPWLGLRP